MRPALRAAEIVRPSPEGAVAQAKEASPVLDAEMRAAEPFDVTNGGATRVAKGAWTGGFGYYYAPRSLLLSAHTQRTYYGWYEQVGDDLALVPGRTKQSVFAEDQAGTFAVGENTVRSSGSAKPLTTTDSASRTPRTGRFVCRTAAQHFTRGISSMARTSACSSIRSPRRCAP
jgi:hypothetical protein